MATVADVVGYTIRNGEGKNVTTLPGVETVGSNEKIRDWGGWNHSGEQRETDHTGRRRNKRCDLG